MFYQLFYEYNKANLYIVYYVYCDYKNIEDSSSKIYIPNISISNNLLKSNKI